MCPAVASEKIIYGHRYHPYHIPSPFSVQSTFSNVLYFQSLLTLDLSNSHMTILPKLDICMPNLQVLKCFNVRVKYITCQFPPSLERVLFDGSDLRYVSSHHVPNNLISLVGCTSLRKAPLPDSMNSSTAPPSLWWKRSLRTNEKIRMDVVTQREVASRIIQGAWKRRYQKV